MSLSADVVQAKTWDDETLQQISDSGLAKYLRDFSWEAFLDSVCDILEFCKWRSAHSIFESIDEYIRPACLKRLPADYLSLLPVKEDGRTFWISPATWEAVITSDNSLLLEVPFDRLSDADQAWVRGSR